MSIFSSSVLRRAALFVSILAAGCGGGSSSEPAQQEQTETAGSEAESMTLDEFVAELARQATAPLCNADDAPLRQCFMVDESECAQLFSLAMTECANQRRSELPATVDASNADATATSISQCAGTSYRVGLEQNGRVRAECQQQQQPAE
ncbi:hypothetical protein [Sandaracinus amylolyticus]|uniref:T2SS substrate NttA domain-containing protein n=1 Tax=Sandaracinus amylolyticus TaxID=927083 RepID=A0A0F6WA69_9BACT|nr:hypothetical protein [Sandaracinus amylolyticus]AKF11283.1 hypothetical protein DB32_008432 [Sandaracinus amylolyticus]